MTSAGVRTPVMGENLCCWVRGNSASMNFCAAITRVMIARNVGEDYGLLLVRRQLRLTSLKMDAILEIVIAGMFFARQRGFAAATIITPAGLGTIGRGAIPGRR